MRFLFGMFQKIMIGIGLSNGVVAFLTATYFLDHFEIQKIYPICVVGMIVLIDKSKSYQSNGKNRVTRQTHPFHHKRYRQLCPTVYQHWR